jgi:thiamine-phosphate pyrophosphorylase
VRVFQYRDKGGTRRAIYEAARGLAPLLRSAGATFLVNDHADIAAAVGADGVHLGQGDLPIDRARKLLGPELTIGISTHNLAQAVAAEQGGADYIGFGPLFATQTKDAGPVQGLDGLAAVRAAVALPIIAIGGITGENAAAVRVAGADGIAVIGAVLRSPDIAASCRAVQESFTGR